ncbi:rhomboid family intramembrane serine protease [Xinfangfangia sp. D13-10-4-6]|uniref:rhomboid family intramembrane serine protease n=1 Tax=Pseudogemmobacter hezensis TaxID=2737662 RepID=UPI001552539D|nr:rhomboid family intramembrane serine protease [Pseudogemmobacter hezensis]NPD14193.1 rhomboid family intramembrane serine protease [Pseudogemmobacter hezensis]
MYETDPNASPFNQLPWIVWALVLPMIAAEIVLGLAQAELIGGPTAIGWRGHAIMNYAVAPNVVDYLWINRVWDELALRFVAFPFIHHTTTSALFGVVLTLALGKMVGEVFRWWAVLVVFFGASWLGALAFLQLVPYENYPLIGAYTGVYGLIGAFTFLLWVQLIGTGSNGYRAFTLIGMLLFVQLVFGVLFGGGYEWIAEVAGFATGFGLSFIASPGGWGRVMARLRNR